KDMSMPSNPKPKPREPYTSDEIANIFAAAESIGRGPYERLRARAIVLLMHFYGLRISDVATLKRDRIDNGHLFLHALKNGALIWLPLYDEVRDALEALPQPKGASGEVDYFFWTGNGSIDSLLRRVERTLTAVFRKSKVKGATAHRFRHTLCTKILVNGGTIEDAANVLGDSPAVIRKHYAKYCPEYQHRTISLMNRVHNTQSGTPQTHEKNRGVSPVFSSFGMVAREVFETRPLAESVAVTEKVNEPACDGVPESSPLEFDDKPGGVPLPTEIVYGGLPPEAVKVVEYGSPIWADAMDSGESVRGASAGSMRTE
ncbi:MAG: site-specific integrase, partial [Acidobacteria bacterium]|nr:site-specific integrase [Acidobacteriota bacterium]